MVVVVVVVKAIMAAMMFLVALRGRKIYSAYHLMMITLPSYAVQLLP